MDSATARRMTLLLAWPSPRQAASATPAAPSPCAQNDAFAGVAVTPSGCVCHPRCAVTLRAVAGSRPPLRRHPARSRRVQAPAALSPCAQSQGPGPRCAVTLRAVAGSRPPLRCHPARSRRVQAPAALVQRLLKVLVGHPRVPRYG